MEGEVEMEGCKLESGSWEPGPEVLEFHEFIKALLSVNVGTCKSARVTLVGQLLTVLFLLRETPVKSLVLIV